MAFLVPLWVEAPDHQILQLAVVGYQWQIVKMQLGPLG